MRTDVTAMKVDMADAADAIREVKRVTRRVVDPIRLMGERVIDMGMELPIRTWVPISRRTTLRSGKAMTTDEGRALHANKRRATLLCTIRAAMRGRMHAATFLRSPELLEELARTWRSYAKTDEDAVPISVHEEVTAPGGIVLAGTK